MWHRVGKQTYHTYKNCSNKCSINETIKQFLMRHALVSIHRIASTLLCIVKKLFFSASVFSKKKIQNSFQTSLKIR